MTKPGNKRKTKVPRGLKETKANSDTNVNNECRGNESIAPLLWLRKQKVWLVLITAVLVANLGFRTDLISYIQLFGDFWKSEPTALVEKIFRIMDADRTLLEVHTDLPLVDTEEMMWAEHVDTSSFMDFINRSDGCIAMVSFFDPRSESFLVTRPDLEATARIIQEDPNLRERVKIGMVNVAVDSYLQTQFSSETTKSWQEAETSQFDSTLDGFRFGKVNYFPLVTKVYQHGEFMEEYIGVIKSAEMVAFLHRLLSKEAAILESVPQAVTFLSEFYPTAIGCFPVGENTCTSEKFIFNKFVDMKRSFMYFAEARSVEVCKYIHKDLTACAVVVRNSPQEGGMVFSKRVADYGSPRTVDVEVHSSPTRAEAKYSANLLSFMTRHRDPLFIELTPDNSWDIIRNFDFLVVLLINPKDEETKQHSMSILEHVAQKPKANPSMQSLKYTYANGQNFASQFGITSNQLPSVIVYSSEVEDFKVLNGDSPSAEGNALRRENIEDAAEEVYNWLQIYLPELKKASSQAIPQTSPLTTAGDEEHEITVQSSNTKQHNSEKSSAEASLQLVQNITDSNTATLHSPTKINMEDLNRKLQPPIEDAWTDMLLVDPEKARRGLNPHDALQRIRSLYEDFLLMEESYQSFGHSRQTTDENIILRKTLDHVFNYIENRPHLKPIVEAIPKTPGDLRHISDDPSLREKLWVNIQRASAYIQLLKQHMKNHTDEDVIQTQRAIADDYTFLYNEMVQLNRKRSISKYQRFVREVGRPPSNKDQRVLSIERRSALEMSLEDFIENYAKKHRPVIITDIHMFKRMWTKEHISEKCGKHYPEFKMKGRTHNWGGLVTVPEKLSLKEFLETHNQNSTRQEWYLHDWGLPRSCPEIMGPPPYDEFIFPKYFAGDYFQRMPFVGYQHSWPSLFVGANGTESKMHIDSGGTNFWMYLLEGEKEWRFYDRHDVLELYPKPGSQHFFFDIFRPDSEDMPLSLNARMYKGIQRPGDLIFIPGGCPHGVRNHDDIIGVSMNYLDVSNEWLYLWKQLVEHDFRDYELYSNPKFPRGLRRNQKDLTFGEFKSQHWYSQLDDLDLH